ncbi:MAG: RluA family pseudouridine synthase [Chloroflexaceae bacterium]|nr:RluA family pseudouridine synthase [Chloroflexaceae bacterium]
MFTKEIILRADSQDRLDRWLASQPESLSRSRIQKLIEAGCVEVNGQVCYEKNTRIQVGDEIVVVLPEEQPLELKPERIPLDILYEDAEIIVINKQAGLVVHPAPGHYSGTLVNALLYHCQDLAGINGILRPGIVHRLDKDTTGAIAVAKTDRAYQYLQAQFQTKTARREYLGVVYGVPPGETGTIDRPLGRHPVDRVKMSVVPLEKGGRTAITHYKIRERLSNYTLLHFCLETGRTHQIRVHCQFLGHPLVGDREYGSGRSVGVNLPGQALHAWKLSLIHPVTQQLIETFAPLPEHFQKLLSVLRDRSR